MSAEKLLKFVRKKEGTRWHNRCLERQHVIENIAFKFKLPSNKPDTIDFRGKN
jgi:hypothetical protein